MGDHNVPNAFMFIDKYTQIPRILNPIVTTLRLIDRFTETPSILKYINATFGGIETLKKTVLCDCTLY